MGRPRVQINEKLLEDLTSIGCTVEEIAPILGVSKRTLETRFCASIKRGRLRAKISLRRMQFKAAMEGNVTMLIWLGKQYLGQSNKQEVKTTSDPLVDLLDEFRNHYNQPGPASEDHQLAEVIEAAPLLPPRMETAISRDGVNDPQIPFPEVISHMTTWPSSVAM